MCFKKLLEDLGDTGIIKITGSYADGTENEMSDIDFYVLPDKIDTPFSERRMLKIIEILKKHNINWNSTRNGYISTIHSENKDLPIQLEFCDVFDRRKNRQKQIEIEGVAFKTY